VSGSGFRFRPLWPTTDGTEMTLGSSEPERTTVRRKRNGRLFPETAPQVHDAGDDLDQLLGYHRLGDVALEPRAQRLQPVLHHRVRGQGDRGDAATALLGQ